jgi:hypothetical protein
MSEINTRFSIFPETSKVMTNGNEIPSRKKVARLAGLLYLIWMMTGFYSMSFIPSGCNMESNALSLPLVVFFSRAAIQVFRVEG